MAEQIDFVDLGTASPAFMVVRPDGDRVAIGWGIQTDGDLDLLVTREDAQRLGEALIRIANDRS